MTVVAGAEKNPYWSSPICCLQLKLLNGTAVQGSDPRCPPAHTVMLRAWLSSSGHGLCVPLKGSNSVNMSSALTSFFTPPQFTVFGVLDCVVWVIRPCWLSDLISSKQAGLPFTCCERAQRRKDVFCMKAAVKWEMGGGEHWYESQLYSQAQSCNGKRARVPKSQKFWQPWRQWAQQVSTKNDLLSRFMFYTRNNRSEDSFEHTAFFAWAVLKVAKLASFFSKTSFFGERRGQKERSGTSKILSESLRIFPLHLWPLAAFLWDKYLTLLVRFSIPVCSVNSHQHLRIQPSS